ncbi:hypothetical protein B0H11DRAFT_2240965 [Mycena galericulata]|nr:hypothetical protein B0H11DRAFT_2240965 [Mycena galericulata]
MSTPDDSVTPSPTVEPRRVDQLWFNDGTLVLVTHTSLFRIYAGLLAKESPVFHDMLQLPQPENRETIDGCPVVRLQDNGRDVEYFLKALFDYKFFLPFPSPTDFDTISGIIRLSKKYEVEALLKRALVHLASAFPTAPAEYPGSSSWKLADQEIRVVLFALEWILPVAFYRVCAQSRIEDILEGVYFANARVELDPRDKLECLRQHTTADVGLRRDRRFLMESGGNRRV